MLIQDRTSAQRSPNNFWGLLSAEVLKNLINLFQNHILLTHKILCKFRNNFHLNHIKLGKLTPQIKCHVFMDHSSSYSDRVCHSLHVTDFQNTVLCWCGFFYYIHHCFTSMTKMHISRKTSYLLPFIDTKYTIGIVTILLHSIQFPWIVPVFCQIFF